MTTSHQHAPYKCYNMTYIILHYKEFTASMYKCSDNIQCWVKLWLHINQKSHNSDTSQKVKFPMDNIGNVKKSDKNEFVFKPIGPNQVWVQKWN